MTQAKLGEYFWLTYILLPDINDTGRHGLSSVSDTGNAFIVGVIDTSKVRSHTELI
jgi:hypothetical protein